MKNILIEKGLKNLEFKEAFKSFFKSDKTRNFLKRKVLKLAIVTGAYLLINEYVYADGTFEVVEDVVVDGKKVIWEYALRGVEALLFVSSLWKSVSTGSFVTVGGSSALICCAEFMKSKFESI